MPQFESKEKLHVFHGSQCINAIALFISAVTGEFEICCGLCL